MAELQNSIQVQKETLSKLFSRSDPPNAYYVEASRKVFAMIQKDSDEMFKDAKLKKETYELISSYVWNGAIVGYPNTSAGSPYVHTFKVSLCNIKTECALKNTNKSDRGRSTYHALADQ